MEHNVITRYSLWHDNRYKHGVKVIIFDEETSTLRNIFRRIKWRY